VSVHRGDTLWGLAAARLGPQASDAEIDAAWRADYAANRAVVGRDPDLILPGQVLSLACD
jgi:nucleoid-associated protein YgaU